MELFIVTLTGTAFELVVSPSDTVMSVKSKIQRFEGIPVGQQHLIWQDNELSNHQSLGDCCIPGGATLRLVLGMRGGPISAYKSSPVATATATIKFTPPNRFPSSSQKNINVGDDNYDISSSIPQSSLVTNNDEDNERRKKVTLYFVNTGDKFDFMRVVDRRHRENASLNDHSIASLLNSEESVESIFPVNPEPFVSNNLSTVTTRSLPYLQTDESSHSGEQLLQLNSSSEPSVLKAVDPPNSLNHQASSPPTAAIIAGYLCSTHGHESNSYFSDTDDCLSSDCGVSGGATYLLRPPSPEWDNQDLNSTPPSLPNFDLPLLGGDEREDDDSWADLEDCRIYCRTGDVLFGPPTIHNGSSVSSFPHGNRRGAYGDAESPLMTQAKLEECESLAEKMSRIKAQLSMVKEQRLQRSMRQPKTEKKRETKLESSFRGTESVLSSLGVAVDHDIPHAPKIRSYGGQGLRKMTFHRPYTTASAVDLPVITTASSSGLSNTTSSLLPPSKFFLKAIRRSRGAVPSKTASETNLKTAPVIPGFGVCNNDDGCIGSSSCFKGSERNRQRRFGTVQPPDISMIRVSDRSMDHQGTAKTTEDKTFPPLMPPATAKSTGYNRLIRPTVAASLMGGCSRTAKTTAGYSNVASSAKKQITLPRISNTLLGHPTGSGEECSGHGAARIADDEHRFQPPLMSCSSLAKTQKDTSQPARESPKSKSNRCACCNRRTGLVDSYTCRCERTFCSKHRYAELHACTFDYKADARRYIRETNPVVTAAKLPKI